MKLLLALLLDVLGERSKVKKLKRFYEFSFTILIAVMLIMFYRSPFIIRVQKIWAHIPPSRQNLGTKSTT